MEIILEKSGNFVSPVVVGTMRFFGREVIV